MKQKKLFLEPTLLLVACAVVGILATRGMFLSMSGFPWIFGVVCLAIGSISLLRKPRVAIAVRFMLLVIGTALAFGGWIGQSRLAERNRVSAQSASFVALEGRPASSLAGLEPLNVEPDTLEAAISYSSKVTIVTFWARWCSPCWTELPELNAFYEKHKDNGLVVIAVTKYDRHEGEAARQDEFEKAQQAIADYELTIPAGIAPDNEIHKAFEVSSIPCVALIDSEGTVIGYGVGIQGGRDIMAEAEILLGK